MGELSQFFGIALRQLRERQGWSQEALAAHADLNRTYIGDLERGRAIPSLLTLEKLALALAVSVPQLLSHADQLARVKDQQRLRLTAIAC